MQMTPSTDEGAPSHQDLQWHSIDWASCHRQVRRLQTRIVKATQAGRWNKVKALQYLLTHSFAAKALAVKRVTENQGKRTRACGRGNLVHPASQIAGHMVAQTPWLQATPAEEGVHPQKHRETAPPGHSNDERPSDA